MSFVRIDHSPTELQVRRDFETTATAHSPSVHTRKRVRPCPTLPFTTVENDPDIAPVFKLLAQFFVSVQPSTGDCEDQHVQFSSWAAAPTPSRLHMGGRERASHHGMGGKLRAGGRGHQDHSVSERDLHDAGDKLAAYVATLDSRAPVVPLAAVRTQANR